MNTSAYFNKYFHSIVIKSLSTTWTKSSHCHVMLVCKPTHKSVHKVEFLDSCEPLHDLRDLICTRSSTINSNWNLVGKYPYANKSAAPNGHEISNTNIY